ncbi:Gfo/Idh/MocA family protein [Neolewinella agarilytica]|uniref:Predicted dehydrogenase n=1 Tax=Neolewinella agarilytica TaxID=478744 RepID=A0A1H9BHJ5_9BACT|nr:Gfo/Idh/MocA family oxidoreductase [Neolewinella agarilytica]SEP88093.1 Predicted dehydrogenase [Neolewinella agarilytica]
MKRRTFIKASAALAAAATLPGCGSPAAETTAAVAQKLTNLRTAHIGIGNMGLEDLKAVASHGKVIVTALCDVDSNYLEAASKLFPEAKTFKDYRVMLTEMADEVDAVIVSTPDHTHAPASMKAMEMGKPVYCQKPLTHHVSEARAMRKLAEEKGLTTQMGIQVHSFYDYKLATLLIQSGIVGKVKRVHAWSPKNWGYDGEAPTGTDPVPDTLDWNLWLGTSAERPYKAEVYHPGNWRKLVDYGCGTLGDMGVHIFDTPYNALALDVPETITTNCRPPNDFGFPENNVVTYTFPATEYTTDGFQWIWYDGPGAPAGDNEELMLPEGETLPEQGALFIGTEGTLLLPHFMELPRKMVDGKYVDISAEIAAVEKEHNMPEPVRDYASESPKHYHQFVDACLGEGEVTAPFSYAARLTETILLGTIAGRFPGETLHWDNATARFREEKANALLDAPYRKF